MLIPLFLGQLGHQKVKTHYVDENIISDSRNSYEIQERIDFGGNAVIHSCIEKKTGDEYAVKFLLATSLPRQKRFLQEIRVLKEIKHEQLINYIDSGKTLATFKNTNKTKKIPFLVMPKAEQNLMKYIKWRKAKIPYEEYIPQFKGLISALIALHNKAIHRDIKPDNILIKGETWFLSDLGLCSFLDGDYQDLTRENEPVGPRYWMSPEASNRILGNKDIISKSSDIFQLCSIFWFVVTGRHPTGVISQDDWKGPKHIFEPIYISLSHDPKKRPYDAEQLLAMIEEATLTH